MLHELQLTGSPALAGCTACWQLSARCRKQKSPLCLLHEACLNAAPAWIDHLAFPRRLQGTLAAESPTREAERVHLLARVAESHLAALAGACEAEPAGRAHQELQERHARTREQALGALLQDVLALSSSGATSISFVCCGLQQQSQLNAVPYSGLQLLGWTEGCWRRQPHTLESRYAVLQPASNSQLPEDVCASEVAAGKLRRHKPGGSNMLHCGLAIMQASWSPAEHTNT